METWELRDVAVFVDRDIARLEFHKATFEALGEALRNNPRLRLGHFFYNFVGQWRFDSLAMAFRRQMDRDPKSISLRNLIRRSGAEGLVMASEAEADIEKLDSIVQRAKEVIDRSIAHRDMRGHSESMFSRWVLGY